jgi:HK97 family phage major capsid protein
MQLHAIREARAAKVTEARALLASSPTLTPEGQAKFDALKATIVDLEQQESRAEFMDAAERRSLGAPDKGRSAMEGQVNVVDVIRAQMEGRALTGAAAEAHQESERRTGRKAQGVFVPLSALENRAVNTTGTAPELVPTDHRADLYIQPFRNNLLARTLGVRVLTGLSGNLSIPKHGTGATVGWVAENSAITASDMSFDSVTMTPKHAGGIQEVSRQLLMQSSPSVDALIRDDLSFMLAQAIDSALIQGGGANQPTGVLATAGIQTANLATLSWPNIVAMLSKLEISNATPGAWLMCPKSKAKLMSMLDTNGLPARFLDNGQMANIRAYATNQVPELVGTPNKGRVILGDWSQAMLGIYSELDILVNPFSETAYSKGNVLIRAMSTVDVAIRHAKAFVVASDVTI